MDLHANMVVIGAQGTIIHKTGKYADVNGFSSDVGTMSRVPIVDAVLAYNCPISGKNDLASSKECVVCAEHEPQLDPPFHHARSRVESGGASEDTRKGTLQI